MAYNYSFKVQGNMARAVGIALPISTKQSVEICNLLRGMPVKQAKETLDKVIGFRTPVPFRRFTHGLGHMHGQASARYPVKACSEIMKMLENAETNAQFKGLNTGSLVVRHISSQKAPCSWHYGRLRRRRMKRTHIEVVLEEVAEKPKQAAKQDKAKPAGDIKK